MLRLSRSSASATLERLDRSGTANGTGPRLACWQPGDRYFSGKYAKLRPVVVADYVIFGLGFALQLMLVWRCWVTQSWRAFPVFFSFLLYGSLRTPAVMALEILRHPASASVYWLSEIFLFVLMFCVGFEVYRRVFSGPAPLLSVAGWLVAFSLLGTAAAIYFGTTRPGTLIIPDVLRKAGLAIAVWVAVMLGVARYYAIRVRRNVLGIMIGVGLLASVSVINFAALGIATSYFPYMRYIGPLLFLGILLLWTWALWSVEPARVILSVGSSESEAAAFQQWHHSWHKISTTLRRCFGS